MAKTPTSKTNHRGADSRAEEPRTPVTPVSEREAAPKPWSPPPAAQKAAPAAAPARTATAVATPGRAPTREEIAERAIAIWKASGCKSGRDEQNWLQAERQLRAERGLS